MVKIYEDLCGHALRMFLVSQTKGRAGRSLLPGQLHQLTRRCRQESMMFPERMHNISVLRKLEKTASDLYIKPCCACKNILFLLSVAS